MLFRPLSSGESEILATSRSVLRVGFLWHSLTSGNLGVGALTCANLAIARSVADELGVELEATIFGMRDGDTPPLDLGAAHFAMTTRSLASPAGYARRVAELDCMLDIGAGDSFAEIYGPKRFGFLWLSKAICEARGVPLVLSPQTIGPFTKPAYRALARPVMNRAAAVVARDRKSLDVARQIAPRSDAHLSIDVAFALPYESRARERGGPLVRIGVNPSGLLFHQAETGRNRFGLPFDYARLTRRLIRHWLEQPGYEVHLVTHATSRLMLDDDDGRTAERLREEFPAALVSPRFQDPREAKSYISSLDFLVAGRMHACIAAFSAGTPVLPISYSRKFGGLFEMLDYPWLTRLSDMDDDAAFSFVTDACEQRDELAAAERVGMGKVDRLLESYRDVLRREFARCLTRRA